MRVNTPPAGQLSAGLTAPEREIVPDTSAPERDDDSSAASMNAGTENTETPEEPAQPLPEVQQQPTASPTQPSLQPTPPAQQPKKPAKADTPAQAMTPQAPAVSHSKDIMLHTSKAATALSAKMVPRLGQVSTRTKSGESLGSLGAYATEWNDADMGEVSSGLTRDRQIIIDPTGPTPLTDKMLRLKKAMQEVDTAWYDANQGFTVSLLILSFKSKVTFQPGKAYYLPSPRDSG